MSTFPNSLPDPFTKVFGAFTPRAVVFDCDGILLDTQALWDRAIDDLLADRGTPFAPAEASALVGRTVEHVVLAVATRVGEDPHAVGHELGKRYRTFLGQNIPVLPGARELVEAVREKMPVAVASNSPRRFLVDNLERTDLLPLIDHVVGADDVEEGKPAPDLYLRACELLGEEPAECLAFEDSDTGALSARAAGLRLVAAPIIPGQHPEADLTVAAIGDPALAAWVRSWTPR